MWVEFNMIGRAKILINSNCVTAVQSTASNPNRCYIYSDAGGEDNSFTVEHSYEDAIRMLRLQMD